MYQIASFSDQKVKSIFKVEYLSTFTTPKRGGQTKITYIIVRLTPRSYSKTSGIVN